MTPSGAVHGCARFAKLIVHPDRLDIEFHIDPLCTLHVRVAFGGPSNRPQHDLALFRSAVCVVQTFSPFLDVFMSHEPAFLY